MTNDPKNTDGQSISALHNPLADWPNDDLLLTDAVRSFMNETHPNVARVLDWEEHRALFEEKDKNANTAKRQTRNIGGHPPSKINSQKNFISPLVSGGRGFGSGPTPHPVIFCGRARCCGRENNVGSIGSRFLAFLRSRVTRPAQRLQITEPEQRPILAMRLDVVGDLGERRAAFAFAVATKRLAP